MTAMQALFGLCIVTMGALSHATTDIRDISRGISIYEHGYCDQPYVVVAEDGAWVCVFTTSAQREGATSQYIVCSVSNDQGRTWSAPVPIESPDGPEASWAMPLLTHFGRIYVFYVYNGDNIRALPDGSPMRADTHGWYCYRYSDDSGRTWSKRRRLPMRVTAADRRNDFAGDVQMFWGIGKPVAHGDTAWFAFSKLAGYFLIDSEGWFYRSDNVLTERDVDKVVWELLPEGDHGLRHPDFGSVQEEQNLVPLSNGDLYCVYRTTLGHVAESYSRDGGRSWSIPELMRYADGRPIKNPRACPRLWCCQNGNYLFWFHNHSGTDFKDRNPAWLSGGVERAGRIVWSQPEIVLYGEDLSYDTGRFSYPDLIEWENRYWITTTQKTRATIHEVDAALLEGLWAQLEPDLYSVTIPNPAASYDRAASQTPGAAPDDMGQLALSALPSLNDGGFTFEMLLDVEPEQGYLLNSFQKNGDGIALTATGTLVLQQGAQRFEAPLSGADLAAVLPVHLVMVLDGSANILTVVMNGRLLDGGEQKQYGWRRITPDFADLCPADSLHVHPAIKWLHIHDRPLRTSQAISLYRQRRNQATCLNDMAFSLEAKESSPLCSRF